VDSKVETVQVFIINRHGVPQQQNCSECIESSGLITPQEAAAIRGVSTRVVYRWLEDHAIHFVETDQGELFICLKTFVANTKAQEKENES
jgi:excisionase family DNA binding protein